MTTIELLKKTIDAFFQKGSKADLSALLADDFHFFGSEERFVVNSAADMNAFLEDGFIALLTSCDYKTNQAMQLDDNTAAISCTITGLVNITYRYTATSKQTDKGERLSLITAAKVIYEKAEIENAVKDVILNGIIGFYIIDAKTKELYYVNNTSFALYGIMPRDYTGQTCHELFYNNKETCRDCWLNGYNPELEGHDCAVCTKHGRTLSSFAQKQKLYGKDVLVIVSKDITRETQDSDIIRKHTQMLERACQLADINIMRYDIEEKTIYPGQFKHKGLCLPSIIRNFPEDYAKNSCVPPDSRAQFISVYEKAAKGITTPTDVFLRDDDGKECWVRFVPEITMRENDKPVEAIIYSYDVTNEKALEARMKLERNRLYSDNDSLLLYHISNITKNEVIECFISYDSKPYAQPHSAADMLYAGGEQMIVFENEKKLYRNMHKREALLNSIVNGNEQQEYCVHLKHNDKIVKVKGIMHIIPDPKTDDLLLYEYVYDVTLNGLTQELIKIVLAARMDSCGCVDVLTGQYTELTLDAETKNIKSYVYDYTTIHRAYAYKCLTDKDRDAYIRDISLENVSKNAEAHKYFTFEVIENGKPHFKRYCAYKSDENDHTFILTKADVTEIMAHEDAENQKLKTALDAATSATRAKSEFLNRMSHEIRTPMNAIIGMTAIAKDNRSDYVQLGECLDKIDASSHFLLTLINDILEMSRIESGHTELKQTNFLFKTLIDNIQTVVEPLAFNNNIHYYVVNGADVNRAYCGDIIRIQQILVNIITNAIKFTKAGGRVRFSVNAEDTSDTETTFKFAVADTGIGMSEEFMRNMFTAFSQEDSSNTSRFGGSGLGLAISKSFVDAMGGTIAVDSIKGIGTTFIVTIPVTRVDISAIKDNAEVAKADISVLNGSQVLMAEDHPLNVMVAKKLLERKGVAITVAKNGKEAVEMFMQSEPYHFDAILMDIRMPIMDGLTASKEIRSLERDDAKHIPIIAMTANALDDDRKKSREAGMNAHLAKPFEPQNLYEVLAQNIQDN